MKTPKISIPAQGEHLAMLSAMANSTQLKSAEVIEEWKDELTMLGTSLSALYQAATCHRACSGGPHVLEALAGRTYNLAAAAYTLLIRGYYDEALSLTRTIGEISNLIAMSAVDKSAIQEWLASDRRTRRKKFEPVHVREILDQPGREHPHLDSDWYKQLCEYVHVNPGTKPNAHNDSGKGFVGGVYQKRGLEKSLGELMTAVGLTALMICGFFKFEDLFAELSALVDSLDEHESEKPVEA